MEKVSVVIATYNGESYIVEQLESIRKQTVKPYEVIIRDDCSKDSTVKIIQNYIIQNKLSNWRLIVCKENIGWKENFKNLLYEATGEIIFLSDQDDIWVDNKIETMQKIMLEQKEITLLASSYFWLIDGKIKKYKKYDKSCTQQVINNRFFHTRRPGCVYAIRRELLNEVKDYWIDSLPHDAQLWNIAYINHGLFLYNEPCIYYRRHALTETGRDRGTREAKVRNIEYEKSLIDMVTVYQESKKILSKKENKAVKKANAYICNRMKLIKTFNIIAVLKILPYLDCYISLKTFFGDLCLVLFKKRR